jgi:hypothetical protein
MTTSEYALAVRAPRAARSSHPGRRTSRGFIRSGAGRFLHCLFYRGRTHQSRPEHRAFFIAKGRGAFGTRLGTIRGWRAAAGLKPRPSRDGTVMTLTSATKY